MPAQEQATATSALPSTSHTSQPVQPSKLAKNPRLPATMITPSGSIQTSQKNKSHKGQISKKKRAKLEKGREKAAELSGKLEVKVREREDRKAKRQRAKKAWE
ncbi:hypothetical protein I307_01163 [Cryptococcus deuterogattii 99/473]|uniref:Uncharacterized protein n=1 Tax=Cryptococcus deuterogattii Ram5 TaxID=1296110 RepID=A0A0D0V608_9TREE|nr:hypothetical protein I309_01323 [Cryptococcus deuterogattii LA55]KIR36231.1 hypothetical protein I352_01177 [Cryptococcus deuterogattii MMRL2647]KIR42811.1 hypothetical protein I313_01016 [Cryptococcus deuterogattii Ram5]KIR95603.1 hypothetical protein I304_00356 [Cryptococcus deuterogattii CBS 10090]KIS02099.1 hypothetical protein L804_00357 [Cryptococcus deuterogattii 2001/935-1]KIY59492.1 hypothetical protein I307_01163 [Cryptococcus deuterogattii 99/473]